MADTTALQAELRALEQRLERQRLEEEIALIQRQLDGAVGDATPAQGSDDFDEYEEEEFTEEYVDEEEEIIEEVVEEEVCHHSPPNARNPRIATSAPGVRVQRELPDASPLMNQGFPTPGRTAARAAALPSQQQQTKAPPEMYDELRRLQEKLQDEQRKQESVSTKATHGPSVTRPSGPFVQRVIPNVEASPPGQETPMELLLGPKLYRNGKLIATTTRAACEGQQVMLLFFAASWNRHCKSFFPKLLDFYQLVSRAHAVECVYVSTDRNLKEFKETFAKMPYLAMPTGTADYKNRIAKELKILDVPHLVVLDVATARVVTTNGVDLVDGLARGDWEQANALMEDWKRTTPVPLEEIQRDTRLVNGVMERGVLYWHN